MLGHALGRGTVPRHVMALSRGTMSRKALGRVTVSRHALGRVFCTVSYLRVPIVLHSSYSLLLVNADKHLYDVYLNNEQYEHESN